MKFAFLIPGEPKGKERHRTFINKETGVRANITPFQTANYENWVAMNYIGAKGPMFCGPLRVNILAYYKIPKNLSKVKRKKMVDGEIRPTKKPDKDNVDKMIFDSLNKVAFKDDAAIVDGRTQKFYGEYPRVEVYISTIDEMYEEPKVTAMREEPIPGQIEIEL